MLILDQGCATDCHDCVAYFVHRDIAIVPKTTTSNITTTTATAAAYYFFNNSSSATINYFCPFDFYVFNNKKVILRNIRVSEDHRNFVRSNGLKFMDLLNMTN